MDHAEEWLVLDRLGDLMECMNDKDAFSWG